MARLRERNDVTRVRDRCDMDEPVFEDGQYVGLRQRVRSMGHEGEHEFG